MTKITSSPVGDHWKTKDCIYFATWTHLIIAHGIAGQVAWEGVKEEIPLDLRQGVEALAPKDSHVSLLDKRVNSLFCGSLDNGNGLLYLWRGTRTLCISGGCCACFLMMPMFLREPDNPTVDSQLKRKNERGAYAPGNPKSVAELRNELKSSISCVNRICVGGSGVSVALYL